MLLYTRTLLTFVAVLVDFVADIANQHQHLTQQEYQEVPHYQGCTCFQHVDVRSAWSACKP
jgi:hypothetical protein